MLYETCHHRHHQCDVYDKMRMVTVLSVVVANGMTSMMLRRRIIRITITIMLMMPMLMTQESSFCVAEYFITLCSLL